MARIDIDMIDRVRNVSMNSTHTWHSGSARALCNCAALTVPCSNNSGHDVSRGNTVAMPAQPRAGEIRPSVLHRAVIIVEVSMPRVTNHRHAVDDVLFPATGGRAFAQRIAAVEAHPALCGVPTQRDQTAALAEPPVIFKSERTG
jgi:hypothetical protein